MVSVRVLISVKCNYMYMYFMTSLRDKNEVEVKFEKSMHNYNATLVHWHQTLGCQCSSFGTYDVHKVVPVRLLIAEKLNYFMTSLRGKNKVKVKFENSMHNYNATLVHWHHTLGCQCSSFGTYDVHKVVPVRLLIAEKLNYFMTSLWGKNEVEVKFENSMHNYNATLVHWHHTLGCQCSSFGTYDVHKVVPVRLLIAEKLNYFMTSLWGKNEVEVKFENSMHNYNATLVHWHHTLGCQCSSFDTYAVHKVVPVRVFIAKKLNYFTTSLRGKNKVEVKFENSMHNYNASLVHWHHILGCQCSSFGTYAVHKVGPVKQSKTLLTDGQTDGQTEIINLIVGLVTRNPPNKNVYFGLFRGPWGGLQWSDWAYLAFQLSSHPYLCTSQIRKQSDKKFLSLNPKYEKIYFFSYLGGPGGPLCRTQVNENVRAVRPHHRADICITREKNNCQFFIYGPQYTKMCIFGYSGGPGWPINNRTGPILLPGILSPISIYI